MERRQARKKGILVERESMKMTDHLMICIARASSAGKQKRSSKKASGSKKIRKSVKKAGGADKKVAKKRVAKKGGAKKGGAKSQRKSKK